MVQLIEKKKYFSVPGFSEFTKGYQADWWAAFFEKEAGRAPCPALMDCCSVSPAPMSRGPLCLPYSDQLPCSWEPASRGTAFRREQGPWSLPLSFQGLWLPPAPVSLPQVGEAGARCRMMLVGGLPLAGVTTAAISRVQRRSLYQLSQRRSTLRRLLCNNPNQKRLFYKPDHPWAPDCKCLFIHLFIRSLSQQTYTEGWALSHVSSFEP